MLVQEHRSLLSERSFAESLRLERKRNQRSANTESLLMVLRLEGLHVESPRKALANLVAPALSSGIRDTDVIGWYERDVALGVVFTDIEESRHSKANATISGRVTSLLRSRVPTDYMECLDVSCGPLFETQQAAHVPLAVGQGLQGSPSAAKAHVHDDTITPAFHIHRGGQYFPSSQATITDTAKPDEAGSITPTPIRRARRALVSIVVPVFNEEDGIVQLEQRLANLAALWSDTFDLEFVFVNDGSSDRTQEKLEAVFGSDPSYRFVSHERNRGIGAAFRTGFDSCRGSIICTIDADCSYGPENLERLVSALEEEAADIAVASPYHPWGEVEGVPRWRVVLSKSCSFLYWVIAPVRLYTYTSVFRAYRRDAVEKLRFENNGFVSAAEILVRAAANGNRIVEVPMTLRARTIGYTKMRILRTIVGHLSLIGSLTRYRVQSVWADSSALSGRRNSRRVSMSDTD